MLLREAREFYLTHAKAARRRPETLIAYGRAHDRWESSLVAKFGPDPELPMDYEVLGQFVVEERERILPGGKRYKDASLDQMINAIKALYSALFYAGKIPANPAKMLKTRGKDVEPDDRDRWIEPGLVGRMINLAGRWQNSYPERNATLVMTLIYTGGRRDEVVGLNWEDVMIDRGHVNYRLQLKHSLSRRVPIPDLLRWALDHLYEIEGRPPLKQPIFLSRRGRRISDKSVNSLFAKLRRSLGVERRLTPSDCRFTFAVELKLKAEPIDQPVVGAQRHKYHAVVSTRISQ